MLDARETLESIKNSIQKNDCWDRLKDATNAMDVAQIAWVMNREDVKKAYAKMQEAFSSFLFETFKDKFASIQAYQPLIDSYISSIINAAQGYGQHTLDLEAENTRLKKELEELRNAK